MTELRSDFLWGAATAAHQIEGNNVGSDWWYLEEIAAGVIERSGDADDSYHRYPEDMRLLADAGLAAYRFSVEWARIEPAEGHFSQASLDHYRRMIDTALESGLTPVVTLHHFSNPLWFAKQGGWLADPAVETFARYIERVCTILDGVEWVCTINEPNFLSVNTSMMRAAIPVDGAAAPAVMPDDDYSMDSVVVPAPNEEIGHRLVRAHHRARDIVRERTGAKVGWTVAMQAFVATPGNEALADEIRWTWENLYVEASKGDDFLGVQAYTSRAIDADGIVDHPDRVDNTQMGWAYRPDALGIALRDAWKVNPGLPLLVTENGIATADDGVRIDYTATALEHLHQAVDDGIDVRGYLHWSALDNFEWGRWHPTFGLIEVDRTTFERRPRPSLRWLGEVARANGVRAQRD